MMDLFAGVIIVFVLLVAVVAIIVARHISRGDY
jgi:uncharacterized membrane protein YqiK